MNDFLGIIPARYASTRFPGKPLAMLGTKPMIQWVYERASKLFEHTVVATDDDRILQMGLKLPVCRVIVNQAHCFATGGSFDNGLPF